MSNPQLSNSHLPNPQQSHLLLPATAFFRNHPDWKILRFTRSEQPALFQQAMEIRTQVFVEEQAVPAENEQDVLDNTALHFLLVLKTEEKDSESQGRPVATARFFSYDDTTPAAAGEKVIKIGRMAVLKEARGSGLGKRLLQFMLLSARQQDYTQAVLDAQTQALGFYAGVGFTAEGETFLDENIPHFRMRRPLI